MIEKTETIASLPALGAKASRARTITETDLVLFAGISGDHNPVHLNAHFAAQTFYGQRVVHGLLTASLISAVLGNDLPGPGSIYLGQTLKFLAPVYIGDTITASAEVIDVREEKRIIILRTDCVNQRGQLVLTGDATILLKA